MPIPVMTYDSLEADLLSYLENTNESVQEQVPKIIWNAQVRISRELRVLGQHEAVSNAFVIAKADLIKPAGWRETITFNFGTGPGYRKRNTLLPRSYGFCREYWPDPSLTGVPRYYADWTFSQFLIAPTPAEAYPFELIFFRLVDALTHENQTNWITEVIPDLLLYACLVESAPFVKTDERQPMWEKRHMQNLQVALSEDMRKVIDASIKRTGA